MADRDHTSSTRSGKGLAAVELNPDVLRSVLRLVHCLQRERGASCAYFSNSSSAVLSLEPVHNDTNNAVRSLRKREVVPMAHSLKKLRNMIHAEHSFKKVLVCYNALVKSLMHEYILRHTHVITGNGGKPINSLPRIASNQELGDQGSRHSSMDTLSRNSSTNQLFMLSSSAPVSDGSSRVQLPIALQHPLDLSHDSWSGPDDSDYFTKEAEYEEPLKSVSFKEIQGPTGTDDEEAVFRRLISLLEIVVKLKESTGVERATLLNSQDSSHWINDLVLEVEQQRILVSQLKKPATGPLQNLIQELIRLSPELRLLQSQILNRSSNLTVAVAELWDILTLYIDKLHALELLIVEELESHLPMATHSSDQSTTKSTSRISLRSLEGWFGATDPDDLRSKIEGMDAKEIKDRLLSKLSQPIQRPLQSGIASALAASEEEDTFSPVNDVVGNLLQELSSTPASKEWEIDLYEIRFLRRIGQGTAGTTYLADWNNLQVAVKVASISEMGLDGWRTEVQALQKLHHPNIIRLLGSIYHSNPVTFCLVLEYCDAGDLANAFKRVAPKNFVLHVATGIARGMQYLHHKNVIHRDIKPGNVLLHGNVASGQFEVKVTDFGVAASTESNNVDRTAETGTYRWMAPEVIRHEAYSDTADVYSYAIVFWQLLTREDPFADRSQIEAAAAAALESVRPDFPEGTPDCISSLVKVCWTDESQQRPSFDEICKTLATTESLLSEDDKVWIEAPLGHPVYRPVQKVASLENQVDAAVFQKRPSVDGKKQRPKGFRTLFSRKSSPYF